MGRHSTTITEKAVTARPSKKRKRDSAKAKEIEIDVSAPEPPSKKALRRSKRLATLEPSKRAGLPSYSPTATTNPEAKDSAVVTADTKRSEYGIWIGNLPWSASKSDVRDFLTKDTGITEENITRLHMPPPRKSSLVNSKQKVKPHNLGFAYVDFSNEAALKEALSLSEKLLTGRRLLIKDSKSFEGRPDAPKNDTHSAAPLEKPPSNRIFVGNLGFDVTKEILESHFARCGPITNIHIATFEDTGKCKGYAWVEFAELSAGKAAIRGWVDFDKDKDKDNEEVKSTEQPESPTTQKKNPKIRKWWVNKLEGRPLRMEFAEGKDIRYKKRFGKEAKSSEQSQQQPSKEEPSIPSTQDMNSSGKENVKPAKQFPRKVDARTVKPGAALAAAPRLTGGIIESQGKKTTFT